MPIGRRLAACAAFTVAACGGRATAIEPPPPSSAPALYWRLKASIGYHYSIGDYGSSESTAIHYVPLVLTADIERWRLQGTIPYLQISGPAGIIEGPNGPIQTNNGKSDGIGDLLLRAAYFVPMQALLPAPYATHPWMPLVDLIGVVKFPTASRSKGLGTGEFDFGFEGDLTWVLGRFLPFATAGFRYLGSPPDAHLDNVFVGSLGGLYRILDQLSVGLLLDYRSSPSPSTGQRLDLVPYISWIFVPPWSLDGYVSAGLAEGSPDVGVGFQLGYAL
jgi:hypothetical protein